MGFKKEHPAALISTSQRAFASQWNQTWQRHVSPSLTPLLDENPRSQDRELAGVRGQLF